MTASNLEGSGVLFFGNALNNNWIYLILASGFVYTNSHLHLSRVGQTQSRGLGSMWSSFLVKRLAALSSFRPLHEHASTFLLFFHLQAMTKDNNKRLRVIISHLLFLSPALSLIFEHIAVD